MSGVFLLNSREAKQLKNELNTFEMPWNLVKEHILSFFKWKQQGQQINEWMKLVVITNKELISLELLPKFKIL